MEVIFEKSIIYPFTLSCDARPAIMCFDKAAECGDAVASSSEANAVRWKNRQVS